MALAADLQGRIIIFSDWSAFLAANTPQQYLNFDSVDTSAGKVSLTSNEFASFGFLFSSPIAPPDGQLYVEPPPFCPEPDLYRFQLPLDRH
jgi:hypothetical protein